MRPIFLIGFMGCGKSTLGKALGRVSTLRFIDLDKYIEGRYHANVRDIFATHGEDAFRDMERRMLREVADFEDVIIACGGGTPCFFDNMELMNSKGTTVWLNADEDCIYRRLLVGRSRRPTIATKSDDELREFIHRSLEARHAYYDQAAHRFDSSRLDSTEMVEESVKNFISTYSIPTNA